MKILVAILGLIALLLGGLWLVQGLGLVSIKPVLCVSQCEPIEGASPTWAAIGVALFALGVVTLWRTFTRRSA